MDVNWGNVLFWWMQRPWDSNIDQDDWDQYLRALSGGFLLVVGVSVLLIVVLYKWHANKLTINHLRLPFYPMRWLWLALLGGAAAGGLAAQIFDTQEKLSGKDGLVNSAVFTGLSASVEIAAIAWILFLIPGIVTPQMFKLRPRAWLVSWFLQEGFSGGHSHLKHTGMRNSL